MPHCLVYSASAGTDDICMPLAAGNRGASYLSESPHACFGQWSLWVFRFLKMRIHLRISRWNRKHGSGAEFEWSSCFGLKGTNQFLQYCEEGVRPFAFKAIVLRMSSSPFLVLWFWLRLCNLSVGSVNWPLVVFIQRKRWRSLTVGNGSGVSACPPVVTVAWGHARALALELSANKPPRPRSVRFPATGRSNLEVSIALLRDLLWFLFWVWSRKPVICLVLQCLDEGARHVFQVHQR